MKKTIMLFAIILFLGMISCSKSKTINQVTYGCFITEIANDGIIESPEKDWWQSNESNVDKIKEITIFDKHCMAKYDHSVFVYWGPKIVDCYKSDEDNLMVYLFRDGSFAGFHKFFEKGYYYDDGNLEDSYGYARNLAIKYAKDYIDVEEYDDGIERIKSLAKEIESMKGHILDDENTLLKYVKADDELSQLEERLYVYTLIKYYDEKSRLKDKEYSIYSIEEQQALGGYDLDEENDSSIVRLFRNFFG